MKFSELTECPFCGNDEYFHKIYVKGSTKHYHLFSGEIADNSELYKSIPMIEDKRCYCSVCEKYLGDIEADTVGREAAKAL